MQIRSGGKKGHYFRARNEPFSQSNVSVSSADLHWIQALRGIAALMVLFFHMHPHWDLVPLLSYTGVVTRWGFSGVDIFFALSGFVVYRSAWRTIPSRSIWPFAKKRLLRICLGYWPVLLVIAFSWLSTLAPSPPLSFNKRGAGGIRPMASTSMPFPSAGRYLFHLAQPGVCWHDGFGARLALTVLLAYASWHGLEKRALKFKPRTP